MVYIYVGMSETPSPVGTQVPPSAVRRLVSDGSTRRTTSPRILDKEGTRPGLVPSELTWGRRVGWGLHRLFQDRYYPRGSLGPNSETVSVPPLPDTLRTLHGSCLSVTPGVEIRPRP